MGKSESGQYGQLVKLVTDVVGQTLSNWGYSPGGASQIKGIVQSEVSGIEEKVSLQAQVVINDLIGDVRKDYREQTARLGKVVDGLKSKVEETVQTKVDELRIYFKDKLKEYVTKEKFPELYAKAKKTESDTLEKRIISAVQKKVSELLSNQELSLEMKAEVAGYVRSLLEEVDKTKLRKVFEEVLEKDYGIGPILLRKLIKDKLGSDKK